MATLTVWVEYFLANQTHDLKKKKFEQTQSAMLKCDGAVRRCYGPCDSSCLGIDGFAGLRDPLPLLLCRFSHPLRKVKEWRKRSRGGVEDVPGDGLTLQSEKRQRVAEAGEDVPADGRLGLPYSRSSGERAFRVYSEWRWARNRPAREFAAAFTIQRYIRAFFLRKHVANVQRDRDFHPGEEPLGIRTASTFEYWEELKGDFIEQMGHSSRRGRVGWKHLAGSRMYAWV